MKFFIEDLPVYFPYPNIYPEQYQYMPVRYCTEQLNSQVRTLELTNLEEFSALKYVVIFAMLVSTFEQGFMIILETFETEQASVPNPILRFTCLGASRPPNTPALLLKYISGVLYSIALYLMLDSALWSSHRNDSSLSIGFVTWLPLLLSSLGMAIITFVEKNRLDGGAAFGSEYGGANETWQAKIVLFMVFAFLSGGLAKSVVILVLKYNLHHHGWPVLVLESRILSYPSV